MSYFLTFRFNFIIKYFLVEQVLATSSSQVELEIIPIQLPRKKIVVLKPRDGAIYELLQFNEKHRSWFLNDTVCSNGKLYLPTKIDPLFVFLQYTEEHCQTKAQPLDQIMRDSAEIFIEVLKVKQMAMVADQKGPADLKAFMWNETKALKWLKKKFQLIKTSLKEQKIISGGASSMNFVKSSIESSSVDENDLDEAALGIISEYISLDMIEKLDKDLGISERSNSSANQKRKSEGFHGVDSKRIKIEDLENISVSNSVKNPPKLTTKAKALEKAAKGSKSISSFFTKK